MAHEHEKHHHHHDHGDHHHDHGDGHHSHDHAHGHDGFHDWHSPQYVGDWIAKDRQRESERLPIIERLVAAVPFPRAAAIDIIDIGAGDGFVTNSLLQTFPHARVTLQDFSRPMLGRARERFAGAAAQLKYVQCDLRDAAWPKPVGGPFDLAVSAIAIHNVRELSAMAACYEAVHGFLKQGGCLLDCDHFDRYGGVPLHLHMLRVAGFRNTETIWHEYPTAVLKASV